MRSNAHKSIDRISCPVLAVGSIMDSTTVDTHEHTTHSIQKHDDTSQQYKVYKLKNYLNSDKNPFGLTLNGS